jgi:hypothetical protein
MISLETFTTAPFPSAPVPAREPAAPSSNVRPFGHLLTELGARIDRGERLVGTTAAGSYAGLDAGQLIALQAGIYRYSEAVELGAKLVDRAASSVRAVLQAGH